MPIDEVFRQVTSDLAEAGALAVVLTGSHARGDAGQQSDVDLYAIGTGPHYRLEMRNGVLVSISWRTPEQVEEAFHSPSAAGAAVPGWRSAVILHDPDSVAADLADQARSWTWDTIGDERLNAWVTEELTGYVEEVFKLATMLEQGRLQAAAVQQSLLALRIPVIMAVHLRLLYDSENVLWDLVADAMGPEWERAQATALGVFAWPVQQTSQAALLLYVLACEHVGSLFDSRQRAVTSAAIDAAQRLNPDTSSNCVVVVLVEQDGRFLMIEENDAHGNPAWYFPAGSVELGESLAEAAIREVREETGWAVEPTHLFQVDHGYFQRLPKIAWWRHIIVARPRSDVAPVPPEEPILSVEWLAPDDLKHLNQRGTDAADLIADYLRNGPGLNLSRYRFSPTGTLAGFYR